MRIKQEIYMQKALTLARKGNGKTSPNPKVGAVIIMGNRVIASDYHKKSGSPHAEILALRKAGTMARGATIFINLEPCCHTNKKTPPCTGAIIKSGIRKVVVAMIDPNPKVAGKGLKELRRAGIETETGLMENEAEKLNESFIKFITKKKPFITLKIAQSLDGKIATAGGESKWITGIKARRFVHQLRNDTDAVLVGIGTVIKDNPSLDCRIKGGINPYRIVVDSDLRIPLRSKVLKYSDGKTIIATTSKAGSRKTALLRSSGHTVLIIKDNKGRVDLKRLVKELAKLDITSVMIEGGSSINASALSSGIVDKVIFFCAPKIIGGLDAIPSVGGISPSSLSKILRLKDLHVEKVGDDFLFEGYI